MRLEGKKNNSQYCESVKVSQITTSGFFVVCCEQSEPLGTSGMHRKYIKDARLPQKEMLPSSLSRGVLLKILEVDIPPKVIPFDMISTGNLSSLWTSKEDRAVPTGMQCCLHCTSGDGCGLWIPKGTADTQLCDISVGPAFTLVLWLSYLTQRQWLASEFCRN